MLQFARFHLEKAKPPRRAARTIHGTACPVTAGIVHFQSEAEERIFMSEKKYRTAGREDLKNPDYSHIKRDLGRIGLIAGSFVVVMIVLAFILR
jgi:hypothetical protein